MLSTTDNGFGHYHSPVSQTKLVLFFLTENELSLRMYNLARAMHPGMVGTRI